jgi:hypothetical protein
MRRGSTVRSTTRLNLLLLLSALLSALSGTSGVRAAQMPTAALSATVAKVAEAATAARSLQTSRPIVALPTPGQDVAVAVRTFALSAIVPAFASRRRE